MGGPTGWEPPGWEPPGDPGARPAGPAAPTCPLCGTPVPPDAARCGECGCARPATLGESRTFGPSGVAAMVVSFAAVYALALAIAFALD